MKGPNLIALRTEEVHSGVDPGFPVGEGATPKRQFVNLFFYKLFARNCMKMKEFGPRGGCVSLAPPESTTDIVGII